MVYADSNFFVRLYLQLGGATISDRIPTKADFQQAGPLPMTSLLRIEVTNAIQQTVFTARHAAHVHVTP